MMTNEQLHLPARMVAISSNRLRRFAPWLIFVGSIIFIQCYYFSSIRNSEFVRNTLEVLGKYKNQEAPRSGPLHILLLAYARTGSSFVGDLMQSIPGSFYHFEPLHFISGPVLNDSFNEARDLLARLFNCNISQIDQFIPWQKKYWNFMKFQRNIRYWKECVKNKTCYTGAYIDSFCRNQTRAVIAKTIRLNLLEASKLFTSHPHLNLKIIYLTRDPRGTMNSRMKKPVNAWCKRDIMCSSSKNFCSLLSVDVEIACSLSTQRPADFLVMRYEDISSDPFGVTVQLMKFLGYLYVPEEVRQFLETHTYFSGNVRLKAQAVGLEVPYTTFRNSSVTAMSWRREMNYKTVTNLQRECKIFLSAFGYHSYQTVSSLRSNSDMNVEFQKALEEGCDSSIS